MTFVQRTLSAVFRQSHSVSRWRTPFYSPVPPPVEKDQDGQSRFIAAPWEGLYEVTTKAENAAVRSKNLSTGELDQFLASLMYGE